jgi:hypothetical protein
MTFICLVISQPIGFAAKCGVGGSMRPKECVRCETHFHKWGKMQGIEPNDSQVHSHFGSCIRVKVTNVQSLGWKG